MNSVKIIVLLVFLNQYMLMAQKSGTKSYVDGPEHAVELPLPSNKANDFISYFNIDTDAPESFTAIHAVEMLVKPTTEAVKSGVLIPQGANLEVYNYYPKYAIYAACYRGKWGFLPATAIRPDSEEFSVEIIKDSIQPPKLISAGKMNFPQVSGIRNQGDSVQLRLLISKTGAVKDINIVKSMAKFNKSTITAVRKLKFKPARLDGKPVEVWIDFPVKLDPCQD